jgi:dihydrofolate reductase
MSEGMKPVLTLVTVMDESGLIGDERGLPWRLPDDIAHFRACTRGKWILVGRTTFEEMRGWFRPDHTPLVLSSRCGWDPPTGHVVSSVPHALALAEAAMQPELVCIGGGQAFAAALPYADKMVLTTVHHHFAAGVRAAYFPAWKAEHWRESERVEHPADAQHAWSFSIVTFERRRSPHKG